MSSEKKGGCFGGCFKWVLILFAVIALCVYIADLDIDSAIKDEDAGEVVTVTDDYCYYYQRLDEKGKFIYDALLKAVQGGKLTCRIDGVNFDDYSDSCGRAVIGLTYDHPELFWIQGSSSWRGNNGLLGSSGYIEITLVAYEYWKFTTNPGKYTDALQAQVKQVAAKAGAYATDYEKAVFVHDYLVTSAEYDFEALAESEKTIHDASSEYIYSAYGCLVNKKTVCAGYAKAFQLIMNELGIPCTFVVGDSYSGEHHGWNRLELGGESYYVDVTWDDRDRKDAAGNFRYPDEAEYDYFCLSTEELERDHILEEIYFDAEPCNGKDYNYYKYNSYQLDTYTFTGVASILDRQADRDIVSVRFTNKKAFEQARKDLVGDKPRVWDISSLKNCEGLRYSSNADQYILTFLK